MTGGRERPLILLTNDDGIASPGLRALAEALADLGDILAVAPARQQSAVGRAIGEVGEIRAEDLGIEGGDILAYSIDSTPAVAARAGLLLLAPRPVSLAFSGINYGENIGSTITTSGTVCAALETATFGVPSVAISLETDPSHHFSVSDEVDFSVAAAFGRWLAEAMLREPLPPGVDFVKVDLPSDATAETPWRLTRLTRQRYFESTISVSADGEKRFVGYHRHIDRNTLEPDSDAHALLIQRVISVCPLTIDLSALAGPSACIAAEALRDWPLL